MLVAVAVGIALTWFCIRAQDVSFPDHGRRSSLMFGVLLVIPIGGADMPTVISLLNSYAGLSAAAMGFVLNIKLLIIAGALDGSSGLILSVIMSKAMNRSFTNVLFGAFGQVQARLLPDRKPSPCAARRRRSRGDSCPRQTKSSSFPATAWPSRRRSTKSANSTTRYQERRGRPLRHPSGRRTHARPHERAAGRGRHSLRPPHGNGRNQRRFPADGCRADHRRQRRDQSRRPHRPVSPIFGMPILDVDKARTVMVIKRGMSPGFAGIDNPLYYLDRTLMLVRRREGIRRRHRARVGWRTLIRA